MSEGGCLGYSVWTDYGKEFDCGYNSSIICEDCKYGIGDKDPGASEEDVWEDVWDD